ncbi:hypothetical protein BJV78DRAFT_371961 [Lactifluus subvellereus]|nr:hypothetical protein BJV78DRAFT_371961 [Lactifluus subvellereus]
MIAAAFSWDELVREANNEHERNEGKVSTNTTATTSSYRPRHHAGGVCLLKPTGTFYFNFFVM